jgi:GT2 family glycosyltransferase
MSNAVLMLTRNSLQLTKAAVESVFRQDIPTALYVVDNGSTDGTVEFFANAHRRNPEVADDYGMDAFWMPNPPLGVSAGWNSGLAAIFLRHSHCLVVNNDVVLRPDCYHELLRDGGQFVTAVGVSTIEGIQGEFVKAVRPNPDYSCFMIRRPTWEKVGPFDESMVLYGSDCDMHLRLHQAGINAYTIGMPFYHVASGTIKTANPQEAAAIRAQADRDRETFEKKWGFKIGSPEYYSRFDQFSNTRLPVMD